MDAGSSDGGIAPVSGGVIDQLRLFCCEVFRQTADNAYTNGGDAQTKDQLSSVEAALAWVTLLGQAGRLPHPSAAHLGGPVCCLTSSIRCS